MALANAMRAVLPILLLLTACATTPDAAETSVGGQAEPTTRAELGPQRLAPGECGLFGWDRLSRFAFFATEDRGLFANGKDIVELVPEGGFPASDYGAVGLSLGTPEPLEDGTRYRFARLKTMQPDGFERVMPLVVIQTCQTPDAPY